MKNTCHNEWLLIRRLAKLCDAAWPVIAAPLVDTAGNAACTRQQVESTAGNSIALIVLTMVQHILVVMQPQFASMVMTALSLGNAFWIKAL